jgi:hypothetical protein
MGVRNDTWMREFEEAGADKVRINIAQGIYASAHKALAIGWLDVVDKQVKAASQAEANALAREASEAAQRAASAAELAVTEASRNAAATEAASSAATRQAAAAEKANKRATIAIAISIASIVMAILLAISESRHWFALRH